MVTGGAAEVVLRGLFDVFEAVEVVFGDMVVQMWVWVVIAENISIRGSLGINL